MYMHTIQGLGQPGNRRRAEAQILDRLRKQDLRIDAEIFGRRVNILLGGGYADIPYIPSEHPESSAYRALPGDERLRVAAVVDRIFKEATTLDRKLDPQDPQDKPWIRYWLKLRDIVMHHLPAPAIPQKRVWFTDPLPASEYPRFEKAIKDLEQKVLVSQDPRRWRYICWLNKLKNPNVDDRIIGWSAICPATSGAIGAAFVIGPCDITQGTPVDQATLQRSIRGVNDVENANKSLKFITYMRSAIVVAYEMTSLPLENLRQDTDNAGRAVDNLDKWANAPMGGSSAMPTAYRAIKDWIMSRQKDPNSLYSCF